MNQNTTQEADKKREYLVGQIKTVLNCVESSIIKVPTAKDVALEVALCCPTRLFAINTTYKVVSLCLDDSRENVLCYLMYDRVHAVPLPIEQISPEGLDVIVRWLKDKQLINTCYPSPIPITGKFWDFIEHALPDYHARYDVLRQSELQLFIDGQESSAIGLTREEAISERDRILYRIYAEAIHAFTRPPQKASCAPKTSERLYEQILAEQSKGYKYLLIYRNQKELLERLDNKLYTISDTDGKYLCDLLKPEYDELADNLVILDRNSLDDDRECMSDWVLAEDACREEVISKRAAVILTEEEWITFL